MAKQKRKISAQFKCPGCDLKTKLHIVDPGFLNKTLVSWTCKWCESQIKTFVMRKTTQANLWLTDGSIVESEKLLAIRAEESSKGIY